MITLEYRGKIKGRRRWMKCAGLLFQSATLVEAEHLCAHYTRNLPQYEFRVPRSAYPTKLRQPGHTYVMMRDGDPWHACEVTILPHTTMFQIDGVGYFDCFLPKRLRRFVKAKQNETRPVRFTELW